MFHLRRICQIGKCISSASAKRTSKQMQHHPISFIPSLSSELFGSFSPPCFSVRVYRACCAFGWIERKYPHTYTIAWIWRDVFIWCCYYFTGLFLEIVQCRSSIYSTSINRLKIYWQTYVCVNVCACICISYKTKYIYDYICVCINEYIFIHVFIYLYIYV